MISTQKYDCLMICALTPEQHARTERRQVEVQFGQLDASIVAETVQYSRFQHR